MYLNQYWKDERLAFSSEENKVLTLSGDFAEKIWVPDTFFANDKKRWNDYFVYYFKNYFTSSMYQTCFTNCGIRISKGNTAGWRIKWQKNLLCSFFELSKRGSSKMQKLKQHLPGNLQAGKNIVKMCCRTAPGTKQETFGASTKAGFNFQALKHTGCPVYIALHTGAVNTVHLHQLAICSYNL